MKEIHVEKTKAMATTIDNTWFAHDVNEKVS